jgi:outer membrane receptor for ferric coprogen and ferric-rhodotorulic acid
VESVQGSAVPVRRARFDRPLEVVRNDRQHGHVARLFPSDAALYWDFTENMRVQANLENIFDRQYYTNADSNTNITPGSPRAVRIGLTTRF